MSSNPIDFTIAPYINLAFRQNYVQKSENYVKVKLTKGNIYEFLENYFYAGWNALYQVQILDDNNIVEPVIDSNINIKKKDIL